MDSDEASAVVVGALIGLVLSALVGGCVGGCVSERTEQAKAVEAKVGRWEVDSATGQTTFVYKPIPAIPARAEMAPSQP